MDLANDIALVNSTTGARIISTPARWGADCVLHENLSKALCFSYQNASPQDITHVRGPKGTFNALKAICQWMNHDTLAAVQRARLALQSESEIPEPIKINLYEIFSSLKLRKEATQFMGEAAVESEERFGQQELHEAGATILSEPSILEDYLSLFVANQKIIALPLNIVDRDRWRKDLGATGYIFEPPFQQAEAIPLHIFSLRREGKSMISLEVKSDTLKKRIVWSAKLLDESGHWNDLGPVLNTEPFESVPFSFQ